MSLGNGNPKEGDKGSNFNYELKVLQGLDAIATVLEKLVGQGNITEDLRELADRLSDYNKGLQWTI